jgi:hypothetical protein
MATKTSSSTNSVSTSAKRKLWAPKFRRLTGTEHERIAKMGAAALRAELKHYMERCKKYEEKISEYKSFFAQLRHHLNVEERD